MEYKVRLPKQQADKNSLINDLKSIALKLNKNSLSYNDIKQYGIYSITTYRNYFGSIRNALIDAGLMSTRNWGTSKEEYLDNILLIWSKSSVQPKLEDMNLPDSKHSASSYTHFFGSWKQALIELEQYLSNNTDITEASAIVYKKSHKTKRNINLRLRFLVMKRDNFKCQICGRSPSTTPNLTLHVDHIKPWSKGGETLIENLQTLCSDCNLGKSNIE